jgi:non-ribosomal peptide synthase protein (TIGR01720 family)
MRFVREQTEWRQSNGEAASLSLIYHDLSMHGAAEQARAIEATATELQASLDLSDGPIVRAALFDCGAYQPGRLLIIVHHLAIDVISWRILLEDLRTAYQQLSRGEAVQLPPKTTSFKQWAEHLASYAQSDELRGELDHWLAAAPAGGAFLPIDYPEGRNTIESLAQLRVSLDPAETAALLQEIPATYHAQPYEVLLTALAAALTKEAGKPALWVDLEGHGREDLFADLDLSRTVGWFTTIFPVCLDLSTAGDPGAALHTVKTRLRSIPNGGIGYGLLRYLSQRADDRQRLAAQPRPEVSFLYLGQADQQAALGSALLEPAQDAIGPLLSPLGRRVYLLEISGWLAEGQLHFDWRYSAQIHRHDSVRRMADRFLDALRSLTHYCRTHTFKGYAAADFPQANLSQADLDELLATLDSSELRALP